MIRYKRRSHDFRPLARREGLSVTLSGDETLVYDRDHFVIHRLDATAASVWQSCDGINDLAAISARVGCSIASVEETAGTLARMGLLEGMPEGRSRRTRRWLLGAAGAAAATGTLVPAAHASGVAGGECNELGAMCCPGCNPDPEKESYLICNASNDENGNHILVWECQGW